MPEGMGYPPGKGPAQAGAAPAAAPNAGPPDAERGTEVAQVMGGLHEGLTRLADALSQVGAPPEVKSLAQNIAQQFQQLMAMVTGGNVKQPSAQPAAAPPGTSTPEAGAANVRPAL